MSDIKSNNPHLTGGELHQAFFAIEVLYGNYCTLDLVLGFLVCLVGDTYQLVDMAVHDCL